MKNETQDLLLMLLENAHGVFRDDVKLANYTTTGTEVVIEYSGKFYRISVELLEANK